ncbi:MAG: hypothetical protein KDD37_03105 [Bdellovibrionales bacterium]|nr:hypothetical protein [Bdellovibrionales bacterium]
MAIKHRKFNGFSISGNENKNIIVTKLQGGGRKIAYSPRGDGEIKQLSVFDRYGKLVSERIDTDMDGVVDQVYECKDQTCERKFDIVNGKPQRLVRTIASGGDEVIEVFEDKQGKLQFVKKSTRRLQRVEYSGTQTEGDFCFDCYDKNYSKFSELLSQFEEKQKTKPRNLPMIDDFYVSRVGVLIHRECFDKFGGQFDVEKAVTDAVVKGMSCKMDLVSESEKYLDTKGQAYYNHIPRLVNLLTNSSRVNDGLILSDTSNNPVLMENPCQNYKTLPIAKDMDVKKDCEYVPEVELGRPKVICQADQFALAADKHNNSNRLANASAVAYGTGPEDRHPSFVNYNGKTKVYNYPVVAFNRDQMSETQFKSTLWHEMMHNCGYSHSDEGTPDYAYMCEIACFGDEYPNKDDFDENTIGTAGQYCVEPKKDDTHDSIMGNYLRAMRAMGF